MNRSNQIPFLSVLINNWVLIFIILVGTVLRFWNYSEMPYMHDELSALSRLEFDGIREVIINGVMIGDTHPAGVQVFLYYWTMLVGNGETWVKLPFILSGILSIILVFEIGKLYFDKTTGLLAAAMIASTQFFVMYSQLARPYSSGLLLSLLMVYFWSLYFFKKRKPVYLLLYVFFAALSSYNHHFSLLFAAIVGVCGLFLHQNKKGLLIYIASGVLIFLLYIPHLKIFFYQLNKGGVGGWLAKPEVSFLFDFINYMLHFSYWVWGIVLLAFLLLIFNRGKLVSFERGFEKRVVFAVWFFTPIIIGYLYSVFVNPIVQYSMLIFSAPYFFILIFSYHKSIKIEITNAIIVLLIVVNITTLIYERKHYEIFYHQPYEELFKIALIENNGKDVFIVDDCVPYYHEFYFNKFKSESDYFTKRNSGMDIIGFEKVISKITEDTLVCHAITGEEYQIIKEYFPYEISLKQGFTYDIHTFIKNGSEEQQNSINVLAYTTMESFRGNWKNINSKYDSIDNLNCSKISEEWGPSITLNLNEIAPEKKGIIDISTNIKFEKPKDFNNVLIVISIMDNDHRLFWNARNLMDYNPIPGKYENYYFSVDLQKALGKKRISNETKIKIYIWNKSKTSFCIDEIYITKRPGNSLRYALYEPFN